MDKEVQKFEKCSKNCCFQVARPVVLRLNFDRHFCLANGVVGTGSAAAYMVFPIIWEALLMYGAPSSKPHSSLEASTLSNSSDTRLKALAEAEAAAEEERQQHRASRIFSVMIFVTATYAVLSVCILLWSNGSQSSAADKNARSNSVVERRHSRNSASGGGHDGTGMVCRLSTKWRTLVRWHLLRNRDFLVVAAAHTAAYASQSVPDIHFYSLVEKHYIQKSDLTMVPQLSLLLHATLRAPYQYHSVH